MDISMTRDITTHFTRFSKINQKAFHELFITQNSISWRDIDFDRSFVIKYEKQKSKDKFDLLQHSQTISYNEYFQCKCKEKFLFYPHLQQYDTRHKNWECLFYQRCNYFQLLHSVDKSFSKEERIGSLNKKGSLMRFKRSYRLIRLDYDLFLWIKSVNSTNAVVYKNEIELLNNFKKKS